MTDSSNRLIWINQPERHYIQQTRELNSQCALKYIGNENILYSLHIWMFKETGEQRFPFVENPFSIFEFLYFLIWWCLVEFATPAHILCVLAWLGSLKMHYERTLVVYTICVCLNLRSYSNQRAYYIGGGELGSLVKIMSARALISFHRYTTISC